MDGQITFEVEWLKAFRLDSAGRDGALNWRVTITDPDHLRLLERSIESDTRILSAKFIRVDGIPMLVEKWSADGVRGCSAVLLTEHVSTLDDEALKTFLADHAGLDFREGLTIVRRDNHTFVNFGFEAK